MALSSLAGLGGGLCAAGLMLRRFLLRKNSAAMLGGRSRRETRYALRAALRQSRRACHDARLRAPTLPPALLATAEIAPPHTARREPWTLACNRWRANTVSAKLRLRAHRPGGASVTPSSTRVSVGARERASCSDSPHLSERSAQRVASCAVRPNPEQHRAVAAGDRHSEAPSPAHRPRGFAARCQANSWYRWQAKMPSICLNCFPAPPGNAVAVRCRRLCEAPPSAWRQSIQRVFACCADRVPVRARCLSAGPGHHQLSPA